MLFTLQRSEPPDFTRRSSRGVSDPRWSRAIADVAKTRGRSRHGCPLGRGCLAVSNRGRRKSPPERGLRKLPLSKDLTLTLAAEPSSRCRIIQERQSRRRGEHPARGPFPLLFPPHRA